MICVVVIKSDTTAIFSIFPVYFIKLSTKSEPNSIYLLSFWERTTLFSSSSLSSPNINGRRLQISNNLYQHTTLLISMQIRYSSDHPLMQAHVAFLSLDSVQKSRTQGHM